jgi:hypothetical protein
MGLAVHFLIGTLVGLLGFLPVGMTNMVVADTASRKGFSPAFRIGIGASLVGILQAIISLQSSNAIMANSNLEQALTWASVPVLVAAGLFYLLRDRSIMPDISIPVRVPRLGGIAHGMFLSTINIIAIPYWMFYGTYLSGNAAIHLNEIGDVIAMSVGGGIGMLLAFSAYIYIALYTRERATFLEKYSSKAISFIMFGLGTLQLARILI